jgi:endo-1,4-beta-D-glucanase Y
MVTDESSEWWMATALNLSYSQITAFTNMLDICLDTTHNAGGPYLTSWVCSRDGTTITKNDINSASDATSRIALGYYECSKNPSLSSSERNFCLNRAVNISAASIAEEWVNVCYPSPVSGSNPLCWWHLAGSAQAWGAGAVTLYRLSRI